MAKLLRQGVAACPGQSWQDYSLSPAAVVACLLGVLYHCVRFTARLCWRACDVSGNVQLSPGVSQNPHNDSQKWILRFEHLSETPNQADGARRSQPLKGQQNEE